MEDKELQQLFEAKRTTEANRRRQEELRRMLERRNRRPLWPVWAGAVAAGIAVVLITLPALFHTEAEAPIQVAHTEVPQEVEEPLMQPVPSTPKESWTYRKAAKRIDTIAAIEVPEEIEVIDSVPSVEPIEPAPTEVPAASSPRVHRRTSTRMVNAPATPRRQLSETSRILADVLCSEESQPLLVQSFSL